MKDHQSFDNHLVNTKQGLIIISEQSDCIIENEQNSLWKATSSTEDLWPGHILMIIHLHGNADLSNLRIG